MLHRSYILNLTGALAAIAAGALVAFSQSTAASKWEPLFDGKSIEGWFWSVPGQHPIAGDPSWAAENGILRTTPQHGTPVYLISRASYRDFELRFEWKAEAGANSGIKYRLQGFHSSGKSALTQDPDPDAPHRIEPVGLEYQITDDVANADAKSTPRHAAGALYDYIEPSPAAKPGLAKPGVWHESRIVARGLHIEHWLDGQCVVLVDLDTPEAAALFARSPRKSKEMLRRQDRRESPIALQIHDGVVEFRNLAIRRL